jgi:hypothetical protein
MAEIRRSLCYNRPAKSERIRHQSRTIRVSRKVSFSSLFGGDTSDGHPLCHDCGQREPVDKDYKLSDGAGLYLLVRPNGSKLWRFNYVHHGKHRMLAFGAWPEVGLADAHGKRGEARRRQFR